MIQELKQKANLYIWMGVLLEVIYFGINGLPLILLLIGSILLAIGGMYYSKAKGYSGLLGVVLGVIGILGLIMLYTLSDKNKIPQPLK
ncbi:MAG: hypothetical protein V1732_03685 [Patescibacteria group bacterium]|nr:hypothetical protein [Patescibacteria group bacterium]MBU4141589.1 hypothetical protein [Patescibacteria group bacterium]